MGGRSEPSKRPKSMSDSVMRGASKAIDVDAGLDSKEEEADSAVNCRRVGVCGVIESAANSSVGIS